MRYDSIFQRLSQKELILPYFENSLLRGEWPDSYTIEIDSRPYYGFTTPDGETGKGGSGDGFFHPSTHPLMTPRQLYYEFHPDHHDKLIREKRTLSSEMTLAMGSALHGVVQAQFQAMGLVREENIEWEYTDYENNTRGRVDFIVDHPNGSQVVCELKTMNSFSFAKLPGQWGPEIKQKKPDWNAQLSMGLDNYGADLGVLLVLESGWPYQMKEFHVTPDRELLDETYQKFHYVRQCIEADTPPRHCCTLDSSVMMECPARYECWLKEIS